MSASSCVFAFCAISMCFLFEGVVASAALESDLNGEVAGCSLLQTGIHLQPNPLLDQGIEGRTSQEFDSLARDFQQASRPITLPLGEALLQQPARWVMQQQPQQLPQYVGMPSAEQQLQGMMLADDRGPPPRNMQQLASPSMPGAYNFALQEVQSAQARVQALENREASLEATLTKTRQQAEATKSEADVVKKDAEVTKKEAESTKNAVEVMKKEAEAKALQAEALQAETLQAENLQAKALKAKASAEKKLAEEAAKNEALEAELLELKQKENSQRQRSMQASNAESRAILLMKHVQAAEEKVRRTENVIRNLLPRLSESLPPADRQLVPDVDQAD